MRKMFRLLIFLAAALILLIPMGCQNGQQEPSDSALDSALLDSLAADSAEFAQAEEEMPDAADMLFDDFMFNFAANKKIQRARIVFPLPEIHGNKTVEIAKKDWKMDYLFMRQSYYTTIFDSEKEIEQAKDTAVNHAVVEKIFLAKKLVRQYVFDRIDGRWMLTSIVVQPMEQNRNASFFEFYARFSTDEAYQMASMSDLVEFTAPDPDDDFSTITGSIAPEQWPSFKPNQLPSGMIYNIIYGQPATSSVHKLFVIRGIANGFETIMEFRKKGSSWKLTRLQKD